MIGAAFEVELGAGTNAGRPSRGDGLEPVSFTAFLTGVFFMCGCKETDNPPYCFGNCTGNAQRYKKEYS